VFIIIKNIAGHIEVSDIEEYVSAVIKAEFAGKHGAIKTIQIFELIDKRGITIERHGLVRIGPDSIIKPLIKTLRHTPLHNSRYTVDEYFIRHWRNERRISKSLKPPFIQNKRSVERRRRGLDKVTISEKLYFDHSE
jgi:hypothetical protein